MAGQTRKEWIWIWVFVSVTGLARSVSLSFDYTDKIVPWEFTNQCSALGGQIILSDTCYFTSPAPMAYSSAKAFCENQEAYVLSLATVEEKEHLAANAFLDSDVWLGLTSREDDGLEWSDGFSSILDPAIMTVSEHYPSPDNCSFYTGGLLTTDSCTTEHDVVCKLKHFFKCYPGWAYEEQTNKCYRIFGTTADPVTAVLGPKNIDDAESMCKKYPDGHLVSTFAGSFFVSWHPFWSFLDSSFEGWIGIFYDIVSPTNLVDDSGAIVNVALGWFNYSAQLDLYNCTYYRKTEPGDIIDTRLLPGINSDCATVTRPFMCQIGPHNAIYPGQTTTAPEVQNSTSVRTQLFELAVNRRLENKLLLNLTAHSRVECAMNCMTHEYCLSFNFFSVDDGLPHVCELNTEDDALGLSTYHGFYYGWKISRVVI